MNRTAQHGLGYGQPELPSAGWNPWGVPAGRKTPLGEEAGESGLVFASGSVPGDGSTLPQAKPQAVSFCQCSVSPPWRCCMLSLLHPWLQW